MDKRQERLCGYEEIAHTADWAIRAWAPDAGGLFATAAKGMYALMDVQVAPGEQETRPIALSAFDAESLLVAFLDELLYLLETGFAAASFELHVEDARLSGRLAGGGAARQGKEIKAVTFHNLEIRTTPDGLETTVVFDV